MILDCQTIELGKVIITDSQYENLTDNIKIPTNCIEINSKDEKNTFVFVTKIEFHDFNKLPLNKKTNIMDMIDAYDIGFSIGESWSINDRENTEMYFTRIGDHKYIVNAIITDLSFYDDALTFCESLTLEATIDFIKDHE